MPRAALPLVSGLLVVAFATMATGAPLTLERIMADPDWIGPPVEQPFWSLDGRAVYYDLKRAGSPVRDLYRSPAGGGASHAVSARELATLDAAGPVLDRSPLPIYVGDDVVVGQTALSPAGRWLLLVTTPKAYDAGRVGKLPTYVTESGYEESEDERTRVGRNDPAPQTLWLVDLERRTREKLAYATLPGIHDDPLASVRA